MSTSIVGARIRERRRSLGLTQADLARRVGISASYLNLIERNRRGIAGKRLADIARALELKVSELDGAAERRLHEQLAEVAADPRLASLGIEAEAAGELIGRFPGWGRAIAALARSEQEQAALVRIFSDRLNHDPFLGETVHRMLTRIAAIRSTAEILDQVPDIDAAQAARFHAILSEESRTLSEVAEALAGYFDKAATPDREVTPGDAVQTFFEEAEHRFPAIEAALAGAPPAATGQAARATAELRSGPVIDRLIEEAPGFGTASARSRARRALLAWAADAAQAPLGAFTAEAAAHAYDIERIAAATGLCIGLVCRRLTALEPAPGRPRFGYIAANAAGAILDLRAIRGFQPVRQATLCPLWALSRAQAAPERALRQLVALPSGHRFVFVARARAVGAAGFAAPRDYVTDMLALTEDDAARTVYGAGLEARAAEEVGTTCRLCPRKRCDHRVEDPLGAEIAAA
ncbi:helix-turn-helix transcriptional regulator [Paralimibaculum aggregatum]|uniref:Helix-turn-helix transcriptional regulator n=1 Tax=Paralimibaculum aggregatum TaxID=3036245 RepID=A0ABQ6LJ37_9RHOB|nr:XRE family transcriptional regulator [Limibaculum sp. NKW23]GMG83269.1 helix-turn-helix transcriptional regulator [Limibaculum sp. NKW23]